MVRALPLGAGGEELTEGGDHWRDVLREGEWVGVEGHGSKGVAASIEHALGEAPTHDQGLGAEVEAKRAEASRGGTG